MLRIPLDAFMRVLRGKYMEKKKEKRKTAAVTTAVAITALIIAVVIAGAVIYYFSIPHEQISTIKIGLIAPYGMAEGEDMDRAAKMAVDEINKAGGIYVRDLNKNVTIELVIIDTEKADPDVGTTAVTRAITQDKIDLLIGGYSSRETMATEVVAIQNNVPFIISGASSNLVTMRTDYNTSYMFHYCSTTLQYANPITHFFNDIVKPLVRPNGNLSIAVIYRDDAFGQGVLSSIKQSINADNLNITIIDEEKFTPGATDFKTLLGKIKAAKPDAVLTAGFTAETAGIYTQGQQDVGLNTIYMAIENNEAPEFYTSIKMLGDHQLLESKFGSYAGPPYYMPSVGIYVSKYQAKYGVTPGMMGADTYDAFYIAKDAIERAGSLNKTLIRDALENTNMTQSLIMMEKGFIQFSVNPTNYHEISPIIFIEQLYWNATLGECRPKIVWPNELLPGIGYINQTTFELPPGYQSIAP